MESFNSKLIFSKPLVSVIIPTLNRYENLKNVLNDLKNQDYKNFEIIIVDQSDNFDGKLFSNSPMDIKYLRQKEKALWLARNQAVKKSKGDFILLSEDDVRFDTDFISNHLKIIDFFDCDISNGPLHAFSIGKLSKTHNFKFSDSFQLEILC